MASTCDVVYAAVIAMELVDTMWLCLIESTDEVNVTNIMSIG